MIDAFADISLLQLVLVATVALIGSIIGGVAGYGTGALMPLVLVPILGPEPVVPIIAISGLLTNSGRVFAFLRHVDWRRCMLALIGSMPFVAVTAYGFTLLTGAGYDPEGMPDFFRRMQRVTNIADTGVVPGYARTHPLTGERIADMADRARGLPHPRQPRRPEFGFAKARARVLQETSTSSYIDVRNAMQSQLSSAPDAPVEKRAALWYGIAVANQMAGRLEEAEQALLEARRLYGNIPGITSGSVDLDVTAIELARARNRMPEALTLARAALVAYPLSRAVGQTYAQTLLAAGRIDDVIPYLKDKTREDTAQSIWWDMLARAYADKGKRLEQHRALAEKYARDGAWGSAVEQLKLAREAGDADFYTLSEVDARLHQMERQYKEEKAEDKALPK